MRFRFQIIICTNCFSLHSASFNYFNTRSAHEKFFSFFELTPPNRLNWLFWLFRSVASVDETVKNRCFRAFSFLSAYFTLFGRHHCRRCRRHSLLANVVDVQSQNQMIFSDKFFAFFFFFESRNSFAWRVAVRVSCIHCVWVQAEIIQWCWRASCVNCAINCRKWKEERMCDSF